WSARPGGGAWTYRDRFGRLDGIRRVDLHVLPPLVPSENLVRLGFTIAGRRGDYPITPEMVAATAPPLRGNALRMSLRLAATGAAPEGQCGFAIFTDLTPARGTCAFGRDGSRVSCAGPPPVGPCHLGNPDDLLVCDLLHARDAETRFFARNGT